MASGEIDVTPGKVLSDTEIITPGKLNQLGTPTLRIKEQAVTSRELADGSINSDKLDVDLEAQIGVADGAVTTQKLASGAVTSDKLAENARIPIGGLVDYAGTTAPDGWLLCGGQTISRTTYAALFAVIGTTYGAGDGSTTFALPDLRGRVVAGKDNMVLASADRLTTIVNGDVLGAAGGVERHTLTTAELASHAHSFNDNTSSLVNIYPSGAAAAGAALWIQATTVANNTAATGSNSPHSNLQPTLILNKIIRYL